MDVSIKGDMLTITVDISKAAISKARPSNSGKTKLVTTSGGYTGIAGTDLKLSLNITAPL